MGSNFMKFIVRPYQVAKADLLVYDHLEQVKTRGEFQHHFAHGVPDHAFPIGQILNSECEF